ncbi:MAG: TolC family protein [Elusimicrobia bacterium]|nr:TolC family protein [Candidatus Liberimonas magnetica]
MKKMFVLLPLLLSFTLWANEGRVFKFSYDDMENKSLESSAKLKALNYDFEAFNEKAKQQKSFLMPALTLDGYYKYNTIVPEIDMAAGPAAITKKLGDNQNYSFGPSLSWVVWDKGASKNGWHSFEAGASARQYEFEGASRQLKLACAKMYFQLSLCSEQVMLLNDSLILAQKQYSDILLNVKAGNKSRKDELSSHTEVLSRTRQLEQAKTDFSTALRQIASLSSITLSTGTFLPDTIMHDQRNAENYLYLDTLDALILKFKNYSEATFWEKSPDLEVFDELASSAKYAQESANSGLWPRLSFSARSSIDYPNGPKIESFNQTSAGANFSMPIFEAGKTKAKAKEYEYTCKSSIEKKKQKEKDLAELWQETKDIIAGLLKQYKINEEMINEAQELASIVYKSYSAGSTTYLEVENANFRLLEAKMQQVKTKVQLLMHYAVMRSLAK